MSWSSVERSGDHSSGQVIIKAAKIFTNALFGPGCHVHGHGHGHRIFILATQPVFLPVLSTVPGQLALSLRATKYQYRTYYYKFSRTERILWLITAAPQTARARV
jgi:hypothetical protein